MVKHRTTDGRDHLIARETMGDTASRKQRRQPESRQAKAKAPPKGGNKAGRSAPSARKREEILPVSAEDAGLFRKTVGKVRPVRTERLPVQPPPPPARARFARADERAVLAESLDGSAPDVGLESGEELSFRRPHINARILKDLRGGKYVVQDELDLHGMTAKEAKAALLSFMAETVGRGVRCIRIIHGKGLRSGPGGPVLKTKLNKWLPQWDAVLAFVSAPRRDGGTGALYVLLKG